MARVQTSVGFPDRLRGWGQWLDGAATRALHHPLATLIVLGLAIRLAIAPFTAWTGDVDFFYWSVLDMLGGKNPYHSMFYSYPPGWAGTLALPFVALSAFVPPQDLATFVPSIVPVGRMSAVVIPMVTSPAFNLALKLPLIVGDLVTGWLVYQLVLGVRGAAAAKRAFAIWFLNPLVLVVGAVNGQFDVLPSLFVIASLYFLSKREYASAGVALAVSAYYKIFAIYLVPVYLVLLLGRRGGTAPAAWSERPALRFAAGVGAAAGVLALVFPWGDGLDALLRRASTTNYGGFTPLALLYFPNPQGLGTLLTAVDIVVPFGVLLALTAYLVRRRTSQGPVTSLGTFAALNVVALVVLFAVTPLVNPQYLLWILPNLILLQCVSDGNRWAVPAVTIAGGAATLFIAGPLVFFYPAAVWYGTPSLAAINGSILNFWQIPGIGELPACIEIFLGISLAGFAILALQALLAFGYLRRNPNA